LARADFPKLVLLGAWDVRPPGYRAGMAHTVRPVSTTVADRIGAILVTVAGAAHEPHREAPFHVNAALNDLWSEADKLSVVTG
jgi:pimeloyl-ACP methyl ester carboxylesterase